MTRYTKKDLDKEARYMVNEEKKKLLLAYRKTVKLSHWELLLGDHACLAVYMHTKSGLIQRNIAI